MLSVSRSEENRVKISESQYCLKSNDMSVTNEIKLTDKTRHLQANVNESKPPATHTRNCYNTRLRHKLSLLSLEQNQLITVQEVSHSGKTSCFVHYTYDIFNARLR